MKLESKEDKRLLEILNREWEYTLKTSPEFATYLGNHEYNNRLSDLSIDSLMKEYKHSQDVFEELKTIDINELSEDNKLNHELFILKLENGLKNFDFKSHYMPLDQLDGFQNDFHRMLGMMPFNKEKDYENYLSRLNAFPTFVEQNIELMKMGVKEGYTNPKFGMLDVPAQIERQLPEDYKLTSYFEPLEKENKVSQELKNKIEDAIKNKLYPSFFKLRDYLVDSYIPACRDTCGLYDLPNGLEFYEHKLREMNTTNFTAKEVHEIGLKEVERIHLEMKSLAKELGFDDYSKFLEHIQTNPDFYFNDAETMMMSFRDLSKRIDKELPKVFKILQRVPYGLEEIPAQQAPTAPDAYYMGPDINMTRAGIYFINTHNLKRIAKYDMEALTLHETVPGHHLQISLALELQNMPEFRKTVHFTGYIEGWGLYAEKLGQELGFYKDKYSQFGKLSFEIWRACRLVIDTGIHAFAWDREKAIEYLQRYTGKSREGTTVEVDRYMVLAGQATAYKLGEIKILELRKKVEELLGDDFNIRDFHDVILRKGPLPLETLEKEVKKAFNLN